MFGKEKPSELSDGLFFDYEKIIGNVSPNTQ